MCVRGVAVKAVRGVCERGGDRGKVRCVFQSVTCVHVIETIECHAVVHTVGSGVTVCIWWKT